MNQFSEPSQAPWLVVGCDGLIGGTLWRTLQAMHQQGQCPAILGTTRRAPRENQLRLDLAASPEAWQLPDRVDVAFLCAGVASIDACEKSPQATAAINTQATIALAQNLASRGSHVIYLSSNQVFDGSVAMIKADAPTCPLTHYGQQKAETELAVGQLNSQGSILRLAKVMTADNALLTGWARSLRQRQPIRPFEDMHLAPVSVNLVVEALIAIARGRHAGIFQLSASQDITYAQAASYLAEKIGVADSSLIQPRSARAAGLAPAATPAHTTMDASSLIQKLHLRQPPPWEALDELELP